jgi:hypothetical protein
MGRDRQIWTPCSVRCSPDLPGALDACRDQGNMPLDREPERVRTHLARLARQA